MQKIDAIRQEYNRSSLTEEQVAGNPIDQFAVWFESAVQAGLPDPNAMSVATVGPDGRPSLRILLIKGFDQRGFTWYTNYNSRKGRELAAQPFAALLFHWPQLERQVSIEGRVARIDSAESDAYFASRPRASRLGALVSAQSEPIADRAQLDARFAAADDSAGDALTRPAHWGGYRLRPERIEFWQGRSSRLHDRLLYTLDEGRWQLERLQP
ncbi:MAG: pyridoxamine 5'-phosphate oxidase [Pseudomonadota bacterium]